MWDGWGTTQGSLKAMLSCAAMATQERSSLPMSALPKNVPNGPMFSSGPNAAKRRAEGAGLDGEGADRAIIRCAVMCAAI